MNEELKSPKNLNSNADTPSSKDPKEEPMFRQTWLFLFDVAKIIILSLAIVLPVRYFLIQPFSVKGASMEPTYYDGEYLIVDEISYRFRQPERGEVVVLRNPQLTSEFFIKRIVGLPNETVDIENGEVKIINKDHPEGFVLRESYLPDSLLTSGFRHTVLSDAEYFVMGDNRGASLDSRMIGPIPKSNIIGRTWIRAWPVNRVSLFSAPEYQTP